MPTAAGCLFNGSVLRPLGSGMEEQRQGEKRIRVLMLVNWKVQYCSTVPEGIQPPDYYVEGEPYWFFRYMSPSFDVDVVDITAPLPVEKLEKKLRFYIWQTLRVLPRLRRYDLVLSHGMQSGIVLALWRRLFGKGRYRHIVFDIGAFNSGRRSGKALKLMQAASGSLDGVIYHTQLQQDYYAACHPWLAEKARFIPFGTDAEFFAEDGQKAQGEGKVGKVETGKGREGNAAENGYILSFGKIKRDWDTLLKAYACSDQRFPLRVIGDPSIVSTNENVEILPSMPLAQLMDQIRGAAFCVVPLEVLPYSYGQMTLLQQMAMGKAVIASDVPSLAAYHDGNGVLWYDPGNVRQLAQRMNELSASKEDCAALGRRAAELVRSKYNEAQMAGEIEQFLWDRLKAQGNGSEQRAGEGTAGKESGNV